MQLSTIRRLRLFVQQRAAMLAVFALAVGAVAAGAVLGQRQAQGAGRPTDDTLVVQRVAARARDPRLVEIERLERSLATRPDDQDTATRLARLCIEVARREADPRYLGRAQAALAPWWFRPAPADDEVLRLRAMLRQARHDFDGALADLERLVARSPLDAQAHLVQAGLLALRGQPDRARASCQALAPLVSPLTVSTCLAPIDAAAGRTSEAAVALERALAAAGESVDSERAWGLSVLGEIRFWAGDLPAAERALRRSLALDSGDRYTRAVLADVLLDAGRSADVRPVLAAVDPDARDEALLLRLAIAERRLGGASAQPLADELRARFAAERRRGEDVHGREEARFLLEVDARPAAALAAATRNWHVQREYWDARVLREARKATEGGR
jgi:tetratricopeptide (TPR) repeat protein